MVCPVFSFEFLHQIRRVSYPNKLDVKCVPVKTNCNVVTPPTTRWSLSFLFSTGLLLFAPCCSFYSNVLLFPMPSLAVRHQVVSTSSLNVFVLHCGTFCHSVSRNLAPPTAPCRCGSNVHIYAVNIYIKI